MKKFNLGNIHAKDVDMKEMWSAFEADHKDWNEDDFQSSWWEGNGFPTLPTIEKLEGGTVLFLTAAQSEEMKNLLDSGAEFVQHTVTAFGEEDLVLSDIDEFYVVDGDRGVESPDLLELRVEQMADELEVRDHFTNFGPYLVAGGGQVENPDGNVWVQDEISADVSSGLFTVERTPEHKLEEDNGAFSIESSTNALEGILLCLYAVEEW